MNKSLENTLQAYPYPYLTDTELTILMDGTPDSRYGKIKRLLAQGKLLHIRRGLYTLTEKMGHSDKLHPYELAQHIYAPSYISLESALSFHQLIPEAVHTITSISSKRSKEFHTPLGVFSYLHLPEKDFYTGVSLVNKNDHKFFMANPWKAICDYVYCYKKDWKNLDPLVESLRIDPDDLPILHEEEIELLIEYYHQQRITQFLTAIKRELP